VTKRLLELGESVHERHRVYGTPLHCAVRERSPKQRKVVSILLAAGADPNAWTDGFDAESVLATAIATRDTALVGQLLDAGARIELTDGDLAIDPHRFPATPLLVADSERMVDFLLDRGADPDSRSPANAPRTIIAAAAIGLNDTAALRMIERGAGLAARTAQGQNALDELLEEMDHGECRYAEEVAVALVVAGVKPSRIYAGKNLPEGLRSALAERALVAAEANARMQRDAEVIKRKRDRSVAAMLAADKRRREAEERPQRALFTRADAGKEPAGEHRYVAVHFDEQAEDKGYLSASRASKSFVQQLRGLGEYLESWEVDPGAVDDDLGEYLAALHDRRIRSLAAAVFTNPFEFLSPGTKIDVEHPYLDGVLRRYPGARVMCGWSADAPLHDIAFAVLRLPATAARPRSPRGRSKPAKR
jgi:hypothetical protein